MKDNSNPVSPGLALSALSSRALPPTPWSEGDNIPWNEPAFSERMLAEHLSQDHDLASRRSELIDAHVAHLHRSCGDGVRAKIVDLGCGPGLYAHRLARLGHECVGIDFSPASIAYAREVADAEGLSCRFEEADLRAGGYGEGGDIALLLYGQLNVFTRPQARAIVSEAYRALAPGGRLVVEAQTPELVKGSGATESDWSAFESGLFTPRPHVLLHERFWDDADRVATDRWYVVDGATGSVERYAMSACAYEAEELVKLFDDVGFGDVSQRDSIDGRAESGGLFVIEGRRR